MVACVVGNVAPNTSPPVVSLLRIVLCMYYLAFVVRMAQNKLGEQILFLFLYFWFLYTHVRARRVKDSPNTCSLPPPCSL